MERIVLDWRRDLIEHAADRAKETQQGYPMAFFTGAFTHLWGFTLMVHSGSICSSLFNSGV